MKKTAKNKKLKKIANIVEQTAGALKSDIPFTSIEEEREKIEQVIAEDTIERDFEDELEDVKVIAKLDETKEQVKRKAFFDKIQEIAKQVNLSEEEANRVADQAVQAVRSQKQGR